MLVNTKSFSQSFSCPLAAGVTLHLEAHLYKLTKPTGLQRVLGVPALLGFSATQAMVIPPISESLKRRRKVPLGLDISMS